MATKSRKCRKFVSFFILSLGQHPHFWGSNFPRNIICNKKKVYQNKEEKREGKRQTILTPRVHTHEARTLHGLQEASAACQRQNKHTFFVVFLRSAISVSVFPFAAPFLRRPPFGRQWRPNESTQVPLYELNRIIFCGRYLVQKNFCLQFKLGLLVFLFDPWHNSYSVLSFFRSSLHSSPLHN